MDLELVALAILIPSALAVLLRESNGRRLILVGFLLVFSTRYLWWRFERFPFNSFVESSAGWWYFAVLCVECLALFETAHFLITIVWLTDRRREADRHEQRIRQRFHRDGAQAVPSVDILIPTYNESEEVVGKTILAATQVDYPRLRVYVLDDGKRPWLQHFCADIGVDYVTRASRDGAKAGNINHALGLIQGDLHLLLDADFIPYRNVLWRTVGFFDDPRVATVQTPQNFYNPDAIQHNLNVSRSWVCEQEFFFQRIMPGRDAIGAAFCCGSCCLHRNAALRQVGGFPTSSITEDILLTVELLKAKFQTVYLREATTMGLAAESIQAFFVQRKRWGRGNIQVGLQILQSRGLSLRHRFLLFPFYWLIQPASRVFVQFIPLVFFLGSIGPYPSGQVEDLVVVQLPFLLSMMLSMFILMRPYYLPLVTESMALFGSFALLPELVQAMIRPYGKGFQVTPKGQQSMDGQLVLYGPTFWPSLCFLILNIVACFQVIAGWSDEAAKVTTSVGLYAVFWCIFNIIQLGICLLMSLDRDQPRQEHRMLIQRPAAAWSDHGQQWSVMIEDLSMSGARLLGSLAPASVSRLVLSTGLQLPVERSWSVADRCFVCRFAPLNLDQKRELIGYLFTGEFHSAEQPRQVALFETLRRVWVAWFS